MGFIGHSERPPKKRLLNPDQFFKRDRDVSASRLQEEELQAIKATPVKKRWNPRRKDEFLVKEDIRRELDDVRQARPQTMEKVIHNLKFVQFYNLINQ